VTIADIALADAYALAPRRAWDDFLRTWEWRQGEHVALLGPSGRGKTVVLKKILQRRSYVALFATKPRDPELSVLNPPWWKTWTDPSTRDGYVRYEAWPVHASPDRFPRRIIWPKATKIDSDEHQRHVFKDAMAYIFQSGGWCVALDETMYMTESLGLEKQIRMMLTQGRVLGISMINASQRPRHIPLVVYSQSTHLLFFRTTEGVDVARLGELNTVNAKAVRLLVGTLEEYQFLYVNTLSGEMLRTRYSERIERGLA
jgi:hypothetical protein